MATLTPSAFMVALVQTASTAPTLLFGLVAGALADIADRRSLPGWARTGLQFHSYAAFEWPSVPVCRFFSSGFSPKNTHFFTPFAAECAALRGDANWTLESPSAFAIALPSADGICGAGLIPVYRFYDGSRGGVPNHRYTTDLAVRAQMISQGWVAEGLGPNAVEMCSPP